MKWVKNFGIKADVLTIYALASGCNFIKDAYGLPNCINYRYIDAEESRTEDYMNKLKEIVKKDIKKWVNKIVRKLNSVVDDFEDFCKKERRYNTNKELFDAYQEFYKKFSYFLAICDVPIFIEEAVSEDILDKLRKKNIKDIDKYFRILTTYLKDTYHIEEEKKILKITIKINKEKGFFNNPKKNFLYKEVIGHWKKYSWTGLSLLLGKEYDLNYFIERIKNISNAEERLNEIIEKQKKNKTLFEKTVKELDFDRELLECGQLLMWIREKRYIGLTRGGFYKRSLFKEIAKKINLDIEDVFYLLPKELKEILNGKKSDINLLKKRKKRYALLLKNGKISRIITGKELEELKKEEIPKVNELKGNPANPGKVKGIVKIILKDEDFSKFKEGDILVTNMTTPMYTPLIKKSTAIITDIGGITCHAAITSREFNKPCIIGTRIATKVLKDGDLIEVDANKGVVRKIKK